MTFPRKTLVMLGLVAVLLSAGTVASRLGAREMPGSFGPPAPLRDTGGSITIARQVDFARRGAHALGKKRRVPMTPGPGQPVVPYVLHVTGTGLLWQDAEMG